MSAVKKGLLTNVNKIKENYVTVLFMSEINRHVCKVEFCNTFT